MAADAQTWKGWAPAMLAALGVPNTPHVVAFLEEWAATEPHKCTWNPLGATLADAHSRNCKHLAGNVYIQAYPTHAASVAATVKQLRQATYAAIVGCLHSGDPFSYGDWQLVVGALGVWGAHDFAKEYSDAMAAPVNAGGPPVNVAQAGRSMKAYEHVAQTLAHSLPRSLHRANRLNREALRKLGR